METFNFEMNDEIEGRLQEIQKECGYFNDMPTKRQRIDMFADLYNKCKQSLLFDEVFDLSRFIPYMVMIIYNNDIMI